MRVEKSPKPSWPEELSPHVRRAVRLRGVSASYDDCGVAIGTFAAFGVDSLAGAELCRCTPPAATTGVSSSDGGS